MPTDRSRPTADRDAALIEIARAISGEDDLVETGVPAAVLSAEP